MALQVRNYQLDPAHTDEFIAWWSSTMPALRQRFGMRIPFAYLDESTGMFVWGVEVDGDREAFLAVEKVYNESPERKALKPPTTLVRSVSAGFVREATPPA